MALLEKNKFNQSLWICFFLLTVSNSLLSYANFSFRTKGWILCYGILLPILWVLLRPMNALGKKDGFDQSMGRLSSVLITVFFMAAVALRLGRLAQAQLWPTGDEALHGFIAIGLAHQWNWQFFYTVGEHPPLLIWLTSFFFKWFQSPFFDLWFLPVLFSSLAIPTGYFLAQRYFSIGTSRLFAFLLAFSFWPLLSGRFCHQGLFIPFWELLGLLGLTFWVKAPSQKAGIKWAAITGIWFGLGTLTFTAWWVVVIFTTVTVLWLRWKKILRHVRWYLLAFFIALGPFLTATIREGYGHHLLDSSIAASWFSPSHQFLTHISYITSLFWGPLQPDASYGPCWGGILNPVLSSCFFIGLAGLWQNRRQGINGWVLLAMGICLMPAFLAGDYVELNRIIQVMPFLLLAAVLGLKTILCGIHGTALRTGSLVTLLAVSTLLDMNQYFMPLYRNGSALNENLKAYQSLNSTYRERGPGLVLTDFMPLKFGHSLYVMTEHFNAADNPCLKVADASWACLAVNVDEVSFLSSRLPGTQWYWMGNGMPGVEGGLSIGVVPLTEINRPLLNHWVEAQNLFHQLNLEAETAFNGPKEYEKALMDAFKIYPSIKGDRFLETCYWEWISQFYFDPTYSNNAEALQMALVQGYPVAHLWQKLSEILDGQGNAREAVKARQEALVALPQFQVNRDLQIKMR